MLVQRIALQISDALVEREQDPIGCDGGIHNCRILCALKSFVVDSVDIVAEAAEVRSQVNRQVLIKLELHVVRIGTRRSSCASSAA
jgi:hypothetical protein